MINIAIVEDEVAQADILKSHLKRYADEYKVAFNIRQFDNGICFIDNYAADYDIIFMDVKMPMMNGIEVAHKLRELDKKVLLFFVTSMQQYAVRGYEVEAMDYIIKPIGYYEFALKITKAMDKLQKNLKTVNFLVKTKMGYKKLDASEILYVEISGHHSVFHTISGDYRQYQTISSIEKELDGYGFARCNNCYLVNLSYVSAIKDYTVVVGKHELLISHPRKKEFTDKFTAFLECNKL